MRGLAWVCVYMVENCLEVVFSVVENLLVKRGTRSAGPRSRQLWYRFAPTMLQVTLFGER